jgi:hypothetical protein
MTSLRRHLGLLRLLLVAAVIGGLLLQPVIAALGDLHAYEHATALDEPGDSGQGDAHDHAHGDGDDAPGDASPLHGLLHACAGVTAIAMFDVPRFHSAGPKADLRPFAAPDAAPLARHPASPFRPPIV